MRTSDRANGAESAVTSKGNQKKRDVAVTFIVLDFFPITIMVMLKLATIPEKGHRLE